MTTPTKSGDTMRNDITIEGKIEDLDTDNPIDGYEYGADLSSEGTPLIDKGIGQTISIRTFEFNINPEIKELPTKQELFNHHSRQISTILWADGLRPVDGFSPRVIIDVKKKNYKIHVVCEARLHQMFNDTTLNLSEQLLKEKAPSTATPRGTTRH